MPVRLAKIAHTTFTVLLVVAAAIIFWQRQYVHDWWQVRNFEPSSQVAAIAAQSSVTQKGQFLFYAAHPALEPRDSFNQHCQRKTEKTIVLGCLNGRNIYIFDVQDSRLEGVEQVTAMHEMLHVAYERLSSSERQRINGLLRQQLKSLNNAYFNDLVAQYEKSEPGEVDNELHSILGTEAENVGADLEKYYAQYFISRQTVVRFAAQYKAVFTESEAQIDKMDATLERQKAEIDTNEVRIVTLKSELEAEMRTMSNLRSEGRNVEYNALVGPYNKKVNDYNQLVTTTKELVVGYNALVVERNRLATGYADLAEQLDSNAEMLQVR